MLTALAFIGAVLLLVALFRLTVTIGFPTGAPTDYAHFVWSDFVQHLVPALVILLSIEPVRRLGPQAGWHRWVAVAAVVIVSAAAAAHCYSYVLIWQGEPAPSVWRALHVAFIRFLVLATLLTMVAEFQRLEVLGLEAMLSAETERDMLEQQTLQARLKTLEAQIEPHFLFNTMATLRRLYDTDADAGRATFDRFIRYLEFAVPSMRVSRCTLGREVDLIEAFLDLQRVRMGKRLEYRVDIPPLIRSLEVPPMMLLTLVENAIKHGLAPKREGGRIDIRARVVDGALQLDVADTGCGFSGTSGGGTGLANIHARLAGLFGARASLSLEPRTPSGMIASISMPALASQTPGSP